MNEKKKSNPVDTVDEKEAAQQPETSEEVVLDPSDVAVKIVINWNGLYGKDALYELLYTPDPLDITTDVRQLIVLLANAFNSGILQLVSLLKPLPNPTEEDITAFKYDFKNYGGAETFALYNYKKAVMEEIATIVHSTLPTAFHDVLYVKGVQEKIFDTLRKQQLEKRAKAEEKEFVEEPIKKGQVN